MKKMTSVIAIILLFALLFTGCDFIPLPRDYSQYGFKFTIAGEITEKEGNEAGAVTLYTGMGTLNFKKAGKLLGAGEEILISNTCDGKETLENGARFYSYNASETGGTLSVSTYYFIEAGEDLWIISATTPESDYSKDKILSVYQSVEFVTAE